MKMERLKKHLSAILTAALLLGSFGITVMAAGFEAAPVDDAYYENLLGEGSKGTSVITVTKKLSDVDGINFEQGAKPVAGVKFALLKVGDLYQVNDGTEVKMAYGISKKLGDQFKSDESSQDWWDYQDDTHYYVADYTTINTKMAQLTADEVNQILKNVEPLTTDVNGEVKFENQPYGLYMVAETDISGATVDNEPVVITRKQYPYVVSAPFYDQATQKWNENIEARAKNESGTAALEKKIVRDNTALGYVAGETLEDTDVTHGGDVVEFKLTADIVDLTNSRENPAVKVDRFDLTDNLSAGFTLPETFDSNTMAITDASNQTYIIDTDYTVTALEEDVYPENGYENGSAFTIQFTDTGLMKLTQCAKDPALGGEQSPRQLYVYYTATVNEQAVLGGDGNPNQAKLTYQVYEGQQIDTGWKEVTEFIFALDVTKSFEGEGAAQADGNQVRFKIYTLDSNNKKIYMNFTGADGVYQWSSTGEEEIALKDKHFRLTGVPTGVELYLEESATDDGFTLLKDAIKLHLTAEAEESVYTGKLDSDASKVKDQKAVLDNGETTVRFGIINTAGFKLPATGSMGGRFMTAGGILIVTAGVMFFARARRKPKA